MNTVTETLVNFLSIIQAWMGLILTDLVLSMLAKFCGNTIIRKVLMNTPSANITDRYKNKNLALTNAYPSI